MRIVSTKIDQALVVDDPATIGEAYNNTRPLADIRSILLTSLDLEQHEYNKELTDGPCLAWIIGRSSKDKIKT
jgi:hypothetical protein